MSVSTLADFNLETASPADLEIRRREILSIINGRDYSEVEPEVLHELAVVARALRKKNAGPPKTAKLTKAAKATEADLDLL